MISGSVPQYPCCCLLLPAVPVIVKGSRSCNKRSRSRSTARTDCRFPFKGHFSRLAPSFYRLWRLQRAASDTIQSGSGSDVYRVPAADLANTSACNAANKPVIFKYCLSCRVSCCVSTQFAEQRSLRHFLQS